MLTNSILIVCVSLLLYLKFYKKSILVDVERGNSLKDFIRVLEGQNLFIKEQLQILFVFNVRPNLSTLEDIDKLYRIYGKEDTGFHAFFSSRFRLPKEFHTPSHFFARYKFAFKTSFENTIDASQIIILNDKKVVFADSILGFHQLVRILQWQRSPSPNSPVLLSNEDLRIVLLDRVKKKNIDLLDIYTRESRSLESIIATGIDRLFIIHANCAGCELNKMLITLAELRSKKAAIVISVYANAHDIKAFLLAQRIITDIFLDYQDGLGLLDTDIRGENTLFTFTREELF
ncbi:MAG TPA: hypothetical protein VLJ16_01970 [Acidobacteriota bacterium]|nr:hypothetical protein [Acidobacteriota bacterium]